MSDIDYATLDNGSIIEVTIRGSFAGIDEDGEIEIVVSPEHGTEYIHPGAILSGRVLDPRDQLTPGDIIEDLEGNRFTYIQPEDDGAPLTFIGARGVHFYTGEACYWGELHGDWKVILEAAK